MTTPTGTIKLSDVNVELGRASSTTINLNETLVRQLAEKPTAQSTISMNDLRGKTYDNISPTITITGNPTSLLIGETSSITFTISESTTNFSSSDVSVSTGSLTGFSGSGTTYTATYTPPASSTGSATISVAANTFTDAAGNSNIVSNTLSISYDTVDYGGGGGGGGGGNESEQ